MGMLLPTVQGLTERQQQLFFVFQSVIKNHQPNRLVPLVDQDVINAADAYASTLETASRGVLYEHTSDSAPAKQLMDELKAALIELRSQGPTIHDSEAARALRAVEKGGRAITKKLENKRSYLELMGRILSQQPTRPERADLKSRIITP
jgi:hypothetical protein